MTVLDEVDNMEKYCYLTFVEFLDMLCRIALICTKVPDTIESKVQLVIEILYTKMYSEGVIDSSEYPLRPPQDTLREWDDNRNAYNGAKKGLLNII